MALRNAVKQARFRDRNVVVLTDDARYIAAKLIDMADQGKLRRIARYVNDHLRHPDRNDDERAIALGLAGPSIEGEERTMNLTLVDKNGNRIECECTFAQRFTGVPGGANQVVLTFEDSQMAKEVFHFVWGKAMARPMSWLKAEKNKEASQPGASPQVPVES